MKKLVCIVFMALTLVAIFSCSVTDNETVSITVSDLTPPAPGSVEVSPLRFEHSFTMLSSEVLKERIVAIQYLADPGDELLQDELMASPKMLGQLTREQAIDDINYLFLLFKHGYSGYGFFNRGDNFEKAKAAIISELSGQPEISRDQLLALVEKNLSFINTGYLNINGKRFYRPLKYFLWDKLDFVKEGEEFTYSSSKGKFWLERVNGEPPTDFMRLSLNGGGDPVYQAGILSTSNPGLFTMELRGDDGKIYALSDNWTDRPFAGGNPVYSRQKQEGVTVITNGRLTGKAEDIQSFIDDASSLKKEPFIVLDLRGNLGGNSGTADQWVTNLTGVSPVWPDTYTVLTTRTAMAGKVNGFLKNRNLPQSYLDEWQAQLKGLGDGTVKRGWSDIDIPQFATIENPGQLIVVLMDRGTAGAESFVGYLKQLRNVVIVGESTMGGGMFGDNTVYALPNSGLNVIMQHKIFAPTDFKAADISLKPDLWVPADDALPRVLAAIKKGWLQPGN